MIKNVTGLVTLLHEVTRYPALGLPTKLWLELKEGAQERRVQTLRSMKVFWMFTGSDRKLCHHDPALMMRFDTGEVEWGPFGEWSLPLFIAEYQRLSDILTLYEEPRAYYRSQDMYFCHQASIYWLRKWA